MLPQKNRITVSQFNQLPQTITEYKNAYFAIKIKESGKNQYPKVAIIVPKFLDKRSTKRHITRRVIEEVMRIMLKNIKNTANIIIKTKKFFKKENSQLAADEIRFLLPKIIIL